MGQAAIARGEAGVGECLCQSLRIMGLRSSGLYDEVRRGHCVQFVKHQGPRERPGFYIAPHFHCPPELVGTVGPDWPRSTRTPILTGASKIYL